MTIICYGDSNTYGYDPRSYLSDRYTDGVCWVDQVREQTGCDVRNLGVNGWKIPNTLFQTNTVLRLLDAFAPPTAGQAQLWVMLGTNDLLAEPWRTAEEAAQKNAPIFAGALAAFRLFGREGVRFTDRPAQNAAGDMGDGTETA